jgi:hypothetical protein
MKIKNKPDRNINEASGPSFPINFNERLAHKKTKYFQWLFRIFTLALLLSGSSLLATTYYVSTSGSDSQPGSQAKPFRTIQHAAGLMKPGDICLIRGGLYSETVRPKMSGTATAPIIFSAFEGETVLISGADPVKSWKLDHGNVYSAKWADDLGKNNQLLFDGKMVYEARWPNRESDDPFDVNGATIEKGGDNFITCPGLPDFPENSWNGAVIWVMSGSQWTSWTAMVTGYNAVEKKLTFVTPSQGIIQYMNPKEGGIFYLAGIREALDAPNEWFYDKAARKFYLWAPDGADPNAHQVLAKKRILAFDLNGRSYVQVIGMNIHAATLDLDGAEHCLVQGVNAKYISHTHGGATDFGLGEKSGIYVSGVSNTIRDCEIAYSVGDGVSLNGTGHRLINCWIHHTDYMGCYGATVRFSGSGHLISHNTIHDTGRDLIQYSGTANIIQYNNVFRCGLLAEDLGFTYTCATDGANSEIHHNWFHENMSKHVGASAGVYYDNFTSNYIAHHNVIWSAKGLTLQLNRPSNCVVAFNNTIIGRVGHWGRWDDDRMYGDLLANNLITDRINLHPDIELFHNLISIPESKLNAKNFRDNTRPGKQQGCVIPGITDGYTGAAPDLGAYIDGQEVWVPGHDFSKHPEPEYLFTPTPYKNQLINSGFEQGDLEGWEKTDAGKAAKERNVNDITTPSSSRNSIIGSSACLQGNDDDGISQTVSGLTPNTRYIFGGYAKVPDGGEVRLGVLDNGRTIQSSSITDKNWAHREVEFTTGPNSTSVTIYVRKAGTGKAFVDWLMLMPAF